MSTEERPRPAPAAILRAHRQLERVLGESRVLSEPEDCAVFGTDESQYPGTTPDLVVLAENKDHLIHALRIAAEAEVPLVPRAAGTGKSGGAIPIHGGIVVSMCGLNQLLEFDREEGVVVVEPGMVLEDLHRTVEDAGWFYPPDPNSWDKCTLGGNVAENAGGPRAYKYGVTQGYVLGLEVFLVGGTRLSVGRRTRKGVTGYDLTSLFVGSEGTLGVFGDLTLRLIPRPEQVVMLMALFPTLADAARAVPAIAAARVIPRCIELLDETTLHALRQTGNDIDPRAAAALFIEADGELARATAEAERIGEACHRARAFSVVMPRDAAERERLWAARRSMSHAIKALARHKLSEDVVVPTQHIPELLTRIKRHAERLKVAWLAYGHAGDGNLHVNFLWNDADEHPAVERMTRHLFEETVALSGTLSGEHGIGILKAPFLPLEQSEALIAHQRELKRVFDPKGLLNPGKIFYG